MEWEKGRQLKKLTKPDGKTITYTYNANGIRTSKTVGTSKHTYILDGTKILSESHGAITTYVHYDNEGSVCGINYNGTPYYFLKNQQGDIIAITDKNGEVVARYRYDAWGVCTIVSDTTQCGIANINPFRYRGYYYDTETGLYYLQSRYYDPETGRFLNVDDVTLVCASTNGRKAGEHNLYAYCNNSPVSTWDIAGCIALDVIALILGAIYGAFLGLVSWILAKSIDYLIEVIKSKETIPHYLDYLKKQLKKGWWELLASVVIGAACGALATTNKFKLVSTVVNLISSIFSAATSGAGIKEALIIGIVTFVIQELMKSAQSFSKFNFKKVGTTVNKTLKSLNKGKASKICNTLVKAIRYYFKSNNTLYKRCFGTFSKYTGAQWAVIFGVGTPSKVVKAVTGK